MTIAELRIVMSHISWLICNSRIRTGYNDVVLVFHFFDWLSFDFSIFFFLQVIFLWIVGRWNLNDGINNHVKVRFLLSGLFNQQLVNSVESFRVDSFGKVCMLFCPILKNSFKIWTYFIGFFQYFFGLFVEIKLHTVADYHKVEN